MTTMLLMLLMIFLASIEYHETASFCYACNPCGTPWNPSTPTIVQTSSVNDFCRKTVTGSLVVKDSASSCTPINVLNNAVHCCQTDYCNGTSHLAVSMISLTSVIFLLSLIYGV